MADPIPLDSTAEKLFRNQKSILAQLQGSLERLETDTRKRSLSDSKPSEQKYSKTKKFWSEGDLVNGRHEGDLGDVLGELKKARGLLAAESHSCLRQSYNMDTLEASIQKIKQGLEILESKMGEKEREHRSLSKLLFTKRRPKKQWLLQLDNAIGCAYLLQQSISVSRCIETVSVGAERRSRLEEALLPHYGTDTIDYSAITTDHTLSLADDRRISQVFPRNSETEVSTDNIIRRPQSSSVLDMKAIGSWSDSAERDLRASVTPRSRTWPTLDEYYPTSTFRIPPPKVTSMTIPSDFTAEPRVKRLFRQWNLPDYNKRHESYQKQRLEGTCEWVLKDANFLAWRDSASNHHSSLLCVGPPGVGKSVLTSFIIDKLSETQPTAYYYLTENDGDPALQLGMSILKQLCEKLDFVPDCLFNEKTKTLAQLTSIEALAVAFRQIAPKCEKFFIIIDALDELHSDVGAKRLEDISELFTGPSLKLCATSRSTHLRHGSWTYVIDIEEGRNLEDVELFAAEAIRHREPVYHMIHFPENRISECAANIAVRSQGRFLRAALSVEQLLKSSLLKSSELTLSTDGQYPSELSSIDSDTRSVPYPVDAQSRPLPVVARLNIGLESIERHPAWSKELAITSIAWTKDLKAPLQLSGLSEALLVNTPAFEGKDAPGPHVISYSQKQVRLISRTILYLCQGVLKQDPSTLTVGFRHEEIEDAVPRWLEQHKTLHLPRLSEVILGYLSSSDFSQGPRESLEEVPKLLSRYHFLSYAAQNWSRHAQDVESQSENFTDLLLSFIKSSGNLALALQISHYEESIKTHGRRPEKLDDISKYKLSPLQAAARYGFDAVISKLLSARKSTDETDIQNSQSSSAKPITTSTSVNDVTEALCIASEHGHLQAVEILMKESHHQADVKDQAGYSALDYAMKGRHQAIFLKLFSQHCLDCFEQHTNPSHTFGNDEVRTKNLLDFFMHCSGYKSAETFYTLDTYREAITNERIELLTALYAGFPLYDPNLDLSSRVDDQTPALHLAIKRLINETINPSSKRSIVEFILRNGPNPDSTDSSGNTALYYAVSRNPKVKLPVQLLLDYGADIDAPSPSGRTALFEAVKQRNLEIVNLLLSNGADLRAIDDRGRTILHEAATYPDEQIIAVLVFRFLRFRDYETWLNKEDKEHKKAIDCSPSDAASTSKGKNFRAYLENPRVAGFVRRPSDKIGVTASPPKIHTKTYF